MLGFALTIGLLVFIVLRLQMINLELNWLRRYVVRILTEQSHSSISDSKKETSKEVDAFEDDEVETPDDKAIQNKNDTEREDEEDDIELNSVSENDSNDDERRIEEMTNDQ